MSDRYWVATNGGNWTNTAGFAWSTTSGGAPGASAPTQNDDVFFDANSGFHEIGVTANVNCKNLRLLGYQGTINLNGGNLSAYGDLELSDVGTLGYIRSNGGLVVRMAGGGSHNVTSHGKSFLYCGVRFENATGTWTLQDDLYLQHTGGIDLRSGTLNINGNDVTIEYGDFLASNGVGPRGLNLGASVINLGRSFSLAANTTFDAGASVINFTGFSNGTGSHGGLGALLGGAARSFNEVNFQQTVGGISQISGGSHTFGKLSYNAAGTLNLANDISPGEFSCDGINGSNLASLGSTVAGTQRTLSANILNSLSNVNIKDIAASGASAPWSGTNLVDGGNNSGITF